MVDAIQDSPIQDSPMKLNIEKYAAIGGLDLPEGRELIEEE